MRIEAMMPAMRKGVPRMMTTVEAYGVSQEVPGNDTSNMCCSGWKADALEFMKPRRAVLLPLYVKM